MKTPAQMDTAPLMWGIHKRTCCGRSSRGLFAMLLSCELQRRFSKLKADPRCFRGFVQVKQKERECSQVSLVELILVFCFLVFALTSSNLREMGQTPHPWCPSMDQPVFDLQRIHTCAVWFRLKQTNKNSRSETWLERWSWFAFKPTAVRLSWCVKETAYTVCTAVWSK